MLVLTRKAGQEICIGEDIYVKVISIQGNKVRLGITAPRNVALQRQELSQVRAEFAMQNIDEILCESEAALQ
ncbi:MAG: carbon storage regulator [Planctomycetes bacterium]|nr:carbon storage regulator [Planctomycetota bacterium]